MGEAHEATRPAKILTRHGGDLGNENVLDAEDILSLCSPDGTLAAASRFVR
jgi:hypothetical protein